MTGDRGLQTLYRWMFSLQLMHRPDQLPGIWVNLLCLSTKYSNRLRIKLGSIQEGVFATV